MASTSSMYSAKWAKPSIHQMSRDQSVRLTLSPIHWWAASWITTDGTVAPSANSDRPWFSSATPLRKLWVRPSPVMNDGGYTTPP